jgi:hypothetical protein
LSLAFYVQIDLKQGDALLALIFSFALIYAFGKAQENGEGLKLDGKNQLSVYVDYVNLLGEDINTMKRTFEALLGASEKVGLKVNTGKEKGIYVSRHQTTGQVYYMKVANISF